MCLWKNGPFNGGIGLQAVRKPTTFNADPRECFCRRRPSAVFVVQVRASPKAYQIDPKTVISPCQEIANKSTYT